MNQYPYGGPQYPYSPPPKKKSNVMVIVLITSLVVVFVGFSIARGALMKKAAKSSAPDKVEYTEIVSTLAKIQAATPGVEGLAEKACPGDLTKPEGFYGVHVMDWDFGARLSGPPVEYATSIRKDRPWDLSDDTIFDLHPIKKGTYQQDYEVNNANNIVLGKYVLMLRAIEKHEPKAFSDGKFIQGDWSGWAILFDYKTAKPLCQTRMEAASSDSVKHRDKGFFATTTSEALMEDLRDNIRSEAGKTLTKMAPALSTIGF